MNTPRSGWSSGDAGAAGFFPAQKLVLLRLSWSPPPMGLTVAAVKGYRRRTDSGSLTVENAKLNRKPSLGRTLLVLGRVSNLPTVWSNCLAGWIIGGGGSVGNLLVLCAGASLIYVGGMYLNDAFDVMWDVDHKNDRPIPAGWIKERAVWLMGWAMLSMGVLLLGTIGSEPLILGGILAVFVLAYDAFHKKISWSPFLMAACRFFLVLTAASVGAGDGVTGFAIWCGFALAAYIVGLSYLAKAESLPGLLQFWPLVFLLAPVGLAVLVNNGSYREQGLVASAILSLWMLRSIRHVLWSPERNIGRAVSGLLAGICLVDLVAVVHVPPEMGLVFLGLFLMSIGFQKFIPAT